MLFASLLEAQVGMNHQKDDSLYYLKLNLLINYKELFLEVKIIQMLFSNRGYF